MTENSSILLKGVAAVGAAALVVGLLIAYTNTANLVGENGEGDEHEEYAEAGGAADNARHLRLQDTAQALHPGRIVEIEPKNGGRIYEIETLGDDGIKWKMLFDAEGKLLRDGRD